MPQQILQIDFTFDKLVKDFEKAADREVQYFGAQPVLLCNIWLLNSEQKEAGGIYLFQDGAGI